MWLFYISSSFSLSPSLSLFLSLSYCFLSFTLSLSQFHSEHISLIYIFTAEIVSAVNAGQWIDLSMLDDDGTDVDVGQEGPDYGVPSTWPAPAAAADPKDEDGIRKLWESPAPIFSPELHYGDSFCSDCPNT